MTKIISYPASFPIPTPHGVLVGGCFDLLHYGHLNFLKSAKAYGVNLVVALEADENIIAYKKNPPIHTQQQRSEILAELMCVDTIVCLGPMATFEAYMELVRWVAPKIIAVTEGDPQKANKERQAQEVGAQVIVVNQLIEGLSSRLIRNKSDHDTLLKVF